MHCIPWGEAVSTDVWLVPDESGACFTKFGTEARFDISHQRVLICPYMSDLENNGQAVKVRCFRAAQLRNLIPFASVSAEDSIESCSLVSADLSDLTLAVYSERMTNTNSQLPDPFAALKLYSPANCIRKCESLCKSGMTPSEMQ